MQTPDLKTGLKTWYDAEPRVRRAWATDDASTVRVFVVLEPTPDGDDVLPVWLANQHRWADDLRRLTNREVQLTTTAGTSSPDEGSVIAAEVSWRDPSAPPSTT